MAQHSAQHLSHQCCKQTHLGLLGSALQQARDLISTPEPEEGHPAFQRTCTTQRRHWALTLASPLASLVVSLTLPAAPADTRNGSACRVE